ncbi:MAG: hypothetical protein R3Y05_00700 [bacterium]
MTNKQKKQLKTIISITVALITLIVAGVSWLMLKITTPPSLEKIISEIKFDLSEISMQSTITNGDSELIFTYIISEENNYIKTIEEENDEIRTTVLYKSDDTYYLYKKTTTEVVIELNENDGLNMFDALKGDVVNLDDYLDVNYDSIKYYNYDENKITYSNYRGNIFYDNVLLFENGKLIELSQTFTRNNTINTVNLKIINDYKIEIPVIQ